MITRLTGTLPNRPSSGPPGLMDISGRLYRGAEAGLGASIKRAEAGRSYSHGLTYEAMKQLLGHVIGDLQAKAERVTRGRYLQMNLKSILTLEKTFKSMKYQSRFAEYVIRMQARLFVESFVGRIESELPPVGSTHTYTTGTVYMDSQGHLTYGTKEVEYTNRGIFRQRIYRNLIVTEPHVGESGGYSLIRLPEEANWLFFGSPTRMGEGGLPEQGEEGWVLQGTIPFRIGKGDLWSLMPDEVELLNSMAIFAIGSEINFISGAIREAKVIKV